MTTPRRITASHLEELQWEHAHCCKAPIEFDGPDALLTLTEKHGGAFIATVESEVCS